MRFGVLGPLRVEDDAGRAVGITRRKARELLGLLLVRVGEPVDVVQLADELWSGSPPRTADTALRVHVAHLRRALGGPLDASPVQAVGGAYRLANGAALDAAELERAVAAAREAAGAGGLAEAAALLQPALALWRGPAYADVRDLDAIRGAAIRLDEMRIAASELLADALLATDQPAMACEVLDPLVAAHPLREGLVARLMLALHRSGRQADALGAYSALRGALDRELGIRPAPAVQALEESIVLQRPELETTTLTVRRAPAPVLESAVFVGRRAEMAALERFRRTGGEGPRVALVSGPSGIGKTALLEQFARRCEAEGATVLVGRFAEEATEEFQPFAELVRAAFVAGVGPDVAADPARSSVSPLARAAGIPDSDDLTAGRYRLFRDVTEALLAAPRPLVVVVEDLEWAGDDGLDMLAWFVAQMPGDVTLVGSHGVDATGAVARALVRGRLARADPVLILEGLGPNEVSALVAACAPVPQREQLVEGARTIHELTGGNPRFVREVLGEIGRAGTGIVLAEVAPGGVDRLVRQRLERLSATVREVLGAAAVLGREFSLALVAATASIAEDDALFALEEALAAGIVVESQGFDRFAFEHALVRNVLYAALSRSRRARLHLRAGEVLLAEIAEDPDGRWSEPAAHLDAAAPLGDGHRVAVCARHAAEDAAVRFARADAVGWYERCLVHAAEAGWSDAERGRVTLELARALEWSGRRADSRDALVWAAALARDAGDADLLVDVAIAAPPRYVTVDDFHDTLLELIDEARSVRPLDERRRVLLASAAAAAAYYDEKDLDAATEAFLYSTASRDPEVVATGLVAFHRWLTHDEHRAEERLEVSRRARDLCVAQGLEAMVGGNTRSVLVNLLGLGYVDEFDAELESFAVTASSLSIPADAYWAAAFRATREMMRDPEGVAEELVDAAARIGRRFEQGDAEGTQILQTFALRYQQGRAREVTAGLQVPEGGHPRFLAGLAILAASFAAGGRQDEARRVLDQVVVRDRLLLPHDNLWLGATALFGGVAAAVGSSAQRACLTAALEPFGDRFAMFGAGAAVFGTVHHWLGRLAAADGRSVEAAAHLERAVERCEQADAGYWADVARADLSVLGPGARD